MQKTSSECRVTHVSRVATALEKGPMIQTFDQQCSGAMTRILGGQFVPTYIWRRMRLTGKAGGHSLRTGQLTQHGQRLMSLIANEKTIQRTLPTWDAEVVGKTDVMPHLEKVLGKKLSGGTWTILVGFLRTNLEYLRDKQVRKAMRRAAGGGGELQDGPNMPPAPELPEELDWMRDEDGNVLSLVQSIEAAERDRLLESLDLSPPSYDFMAAARMASHEGADQKWVDVVPIAYRGYTLENYQTIQAIKRRYDLDVLDVISVCPFCGTLMDKKGEHMLKCKYGPTTANVRHNMLRDWLLKWIRKFIGNADIEHHGGLGTNERPGDIIIFNWEGNRHLLIDLTVVDGMETHADVTVRDGPDTAATVAELAKIDIYGPRLDANQYIFMPWGFDSTGAKGDYGKQLMTMLEERRQRKEAGLSSLYSAGSKANLDLRLGLLLQRCHGDSIRDRLPRFLPDDQDSRQTRHQQKLTHSAKVLNTIANAAFSELTQQAHASVGYDMFKTNAENDLADQIRRLVDKHDDMGPDFDDTTTTTTTTNTTTTPRLPPLPVRISQRQVEQPTATIASLYFTEQLNYQLANAQLESQDAPFSTPIVPTQSSPSLSTTSTSKNASLEPRTQHSTSTSDAPNCSQEANADSTNSTTNSNLKTMTPTMTSPQQLDIHNQHTRRLSHDLDITMDMTIDTTAESRGDDGDGQYDDEQRHDGLLDIQYTKHSASSTTPSAMFDPQSTLSTQLEPASNIPPTSTSTSTTTSNISAPISIQLHPAAASMQPATPQCIHSSMVPLGRGAADLSAVIRDR